MNTVGQRGQVFEVDCAITGKVPKVLVCICDTYFWYLLQSDPLNLVIWQESDEA